MTEKFLPVGLQDFERIITGDFIYVDKTRYLYEMARPGQGFYFLSRPRRFGKSLTVSTLKYLFKGKRELFDGLWIAEHGKWDWKEHPVVIIDFNELANETPENLRISLDNSLLTIAESHGLNLNDDLLLPGRFTALIVALYEKTGTRVVVLVDEYDKPIISHLGKGQEGLEVAKKNRDVLKSFFGVLKGAHVSPCLRFVFLTGVSKFSRVSIFSELNNLEDLSMAGAYADMLGYTQAELEQYFDVHIRAMGDQLGISKDDVIAKLIRNYNGYRFSRKDVRVYNPFSVMSALKQNAFDRYWFETGTPTFLVDLLRERDWYLPQIEEMIAAESLFSMYEIEDLSPEALLFQTGYITIKNVEDHLYTFGYPNREVKKAFLESLLKSYTKGMSDRSRFTLLSRYLKNEDLDGFMETVTSIFASIPYTAAAKRDEAYFHTIFYLMVSASGIDSRSEVLTCQGRIDLVIEFADKIYIIEFKCNQSADAALKQIHEKNYPDRYREPGKKIFLMGIDFDSEKRNVGEWKWEALPKRKGEGQ